MKVSRPTLRQQPQFHPTAACSSPSPSWLCWTSPICFPKFIFHPLIFYSVPDYSPLGSSWFGFQGDLAGDQRKESKSSSSVPQPDYEVDSGRCTLEEWSRLLLLSSCLYTAPLLGSSIFSFPYLLGPKTIFG